MKTLSVIYLATTLVFAVVSYGFIDPHLSFSVNPVYQWYQHKVATLIYEMPYIAALTFIGIITVLYAVYTYLLRFFRTYKGGIPRWVLGVAAILLISYPALSYDIYNYILTAKLTFQYQENPYVVMPIEIPNEPWLTFTRAANKLALYGPAWIVLTSLPFFLGRGIIFWEVIAFKLFTGLFYLFMCFLIYRKTKRWENTAFFALNPLVLVETLSSGHNDIVMTVLALSGLFLWQRKRMFYTWAGISLFLSSILIKGATVVLLPLVFVSHWNWEQKVKLGYWLMFFVFLLSPLREEMYPWYAIWWLSFAAFLPITKQSFVHGFSTWLSFGLMLGYVPWIATREYGGVTPLVRSALQIAPATIYVLTRVVRGR